MVKGRHQNSATRFPNSDFWKYIIVKSQALQVGSRGSDRNAQQYAKMEPQPGQTRRTKRNFGTLNMLILHKECIDLGLSGPDMQRLCLEDKSAGSAELYTKMVPQHGQRGEPRGTSGPSKS